MCPTPKLWTVPVKHLINGLTECNIHVNVHVFDGGDRCKVIGGREIVKLRRRRREQIAVIEADVPVRALGRIHRWRYVTQYRRLVDPCADTDPERRYKTGRYADVGALSPYKQLVKICTLVDGARSRGRGDRNVQGVEWTPQVKKCRHWRCQLWGTGTRAPLRHPIVYFTSTSNCLFFLVTSEPHKLCY